MSKLKFGDKVIWTKERSDSSGKKTISYSCLFMYENAAGALVECKEKVCGYAKLDELQKVENFKELL